MTSQQDDSLTSISLILRGREVADRRGRLGRVRRPLRPEDPGLGEGAGGSNRPTPKDVAQAVLVKLARQMRRFDYDPSKTFRRLAPDHRPQRLARLDGPARGEGTGPGRRRGRLGPGEPRGPRGPGPPARRNLRLGGPGPRPYDGPATGPPRRPGRRTGWSSRRTCRPREVADRLGMTIATVFKSKSNILKMISEEVAGLDAGARRGRLARGGGSDDGPDRAQGLRLLRPARSHACRPA